VKILHVIGSVDPQGGGTTNHVFSSAEVWSRHGHECHVLCLDPPNAECVVQSPWTIFAIGPRPANSVRRLLPFLRYGYTRSLAKWLNKNAKNYDAIILNGLWNYTSYGSWLVLRKLGVPYFVCPHGMLDPWLAKANPTSHFLKKVFWRFFEQNVIRDARGIFYACEEERQLAQAFVSGCNCHEFIVGYGAQDISGDENAQKAAFLAKFPELAERKLILFLSRIHPKKGLDLLIRAFARHARERPEFDLLIAGPDQVGLTPQLKKLAAKFGLEKRIHWVGMLSGNEKWGAFRSASFFVLPSHQENFGIAVVEAMALRIPVLITKKVNIWQEVQRSNSGRVIMDDVDDISHGLNYFCTLAPDQIRLLGQNARSCFEEHFNLEKNAIEVVDLMMELCRAPHNKNKMSLGKGA
jgi:glycosyltransferase involved in cell wall biosynthesis